MLYHYKRDIISKQLATGVLFSQDNKDRLEIITYPPDKLPYELTNVKSIIHKRKTIETIEDEYTTKSMLGCDYFKISNNNILSGDTYNFKTNRHHFEYDQDMGILQAFEIIDNYKKDYPSKYFVIRSLDHNKRFNGNNVELSELYFCRDCEVYCWSKNRMIIPEFILSEFIKKIV